MSITFKNLFRESNIDFVENLPLSKYTTFKIGGNADVGVFPKNEEQAIKVFDIIRANSLKYIILGNGSNVLVSDEGFSGVAVILSGMHGYSVCDTTVTASAGMPLTRLAFVACENSLSGLEFAYGIPGTVGGGIYMNAGAYGGEVGKVLLSSKWYDMNTGKVGEYTNAEHCFAYRNSIYMNEDKIILSAKFKLETADKDGILSKMNEYMYSRREKQPLEYPSAGSVFKRGNGFITAKLIEEAGLKGRRVGNAQVSEKHAGFIVNLGGATACDVLKLVDIVKDEIFEKYGYKIECEVRIVRNYGM